MNIIFTEPWTISLFGPSSLLDYVVYKHIYLESFSDLSLLSADQRLQTKAIFVKLGFTVDSDLLDLLPALKYVATPTTGINHIDVVELKTRGVTLISLERQYDILNSITTTAEHAWMLLLASIRDLKFTDSLVGSGLWQRDATRINQLSQKTIGIIGYGRLGRILLDYANAFRMKVLVTDLYVIRDLPRFALQVSLDELLISSDAVLLAASQSENPTQILNSDNLPLLKQNSVLVNVSRGELVDNNCICKLLQARPDFRYAADVLPGDSDWDERILYNPYQSVLSQRNFRLTPHVGGYALEATTATRSFCYNSLIQFLRNEIYC